SWIDWSLAESPAGKALMAFVARLTALRRQYPVLRCSRFLHGKDEPAPGIIDIAWFDEQGGAISPDAWNDPHRKVLTLRRTEKLDDGVNILTCFCNPEAEDRIFKLPAPRLPTHVLADSASPAASEWKLDEADTLTVKARSVVLTRSVQPIMPK